MANITPIQESPAEHLRNALQIAQLWEGYLDGSLTEERRAAANAFTGIAQRLRHALVQLGEPSPHAIAALRKVLETHQGIMEMEPDYDRYLRDSAAVILKAQVTGDAP